ncbi:hypothetical protein ACFV2Z_35950 [Streptomyces sp. NPDC059688]|uniref:hypothetical protein n=1 Tax=Streptomyces sp. NPDC059688 TaxID=3346906 RepID=UPI003688BF16
MSHKPGLKRDLAAERAARKAATQQARLVPQGLPTARPDQLMPSPENGRKELHKIDELANTLRTDGMNTAMTVIPPDVFIELYPQYKDEVEARVAEGVLFVVHHGHRRLAAAVQAGLPEVPILVRREVPSLRIAAIQENLQRMGLNPIEEAEEFQGALDEKDVTGKRLSQRELSKRVGCSQTYISQRIALLRLIPSLKQAVIDHWLKEQQLLEGPEQDSDADARLLLPVRDAAVTYSRLSIEMQEAFVRGELSPLQAATISKLPVEQQAIPAPEAESDCAAITDTEPATAAPLPEPRASEPRQISAAPANQPQPHAPAPRPPQTTTDATRKTDSAPAPAPVTAAAATAVEEPRGVIVVRSVEDLALNIVDLLTEAEIKQLKELLSS